MIPASKPANEQQRLEDLYSFNVLDTAAERDFDELADLAAMICGTSMSAVTFIDKGRQWFKARVGIAAPGTAREEAICAHAILQSDLFIVENTLNDQRFNPLPTVLEDPADAFVSKEQDLKLKGFTDSVVKPFDRSELCAKMGEWYNEVMQEKGL
jgi:GAF domain-containing protein